MGPRSDAGVTLADLSEEGEGVDAGEVTVRPGEPERVRAHPAHLAGMNVIGYRPGIEAPLAGELIDAKRTWTPLPQCPKDMPAAVTIVPDDDEGTLLLVNVGRNGDSRHLR